jgi:hypothetical protein
MPCVRAPMIYSPNAAKPILGGDHTSSSVLVATIMVWRLDYSAMIYEPLHPQ